MVVVAWATPAWGSDPPMGRVGRPRGNEEYNLNERRGAKQEEPDEGEDHDAHVARVFQ